MNKPRIEVIAHNPEDTKLASIFEKVLNYIAENDESEETVNMITDKLLELLLK